MNNPFNVADPAELESTDIDTIRRVAARLREIGSEWSARIIEIDAGIGRFEPVEHVHDQDRDDYIQSLRSYADLLENTPDLPIGLSSTISHTVYAFESENAAARMRELRRMYGGRFEKSWDDHPTYAEYFLKGKCGVLNVVISTARDNVCERVVTGTIEEVVTAPDPELVEALPKIEQTIVKEVVEWICPEDLTT